MTTTLTAPPAAPIVRRPLPDPSEVPGIYESLGLKPIRKENYHKNDDGALESCCALTAVYVTRVPCGLQTLDHRLVSHRYRDLQISVDYEAGAADGFDGMDRTLGYAKGLPKTSEYWAGRTWGQAAWKACVDAGLTDADETNVIDAPAMGSDLAALDACD